MGMYFVSRNGQRDLKFKGERLASVSKHSRFGKKTWYTLYRTWGGRYVCQKTTKWFSSVKSTAIVVSYIENIDYFFGAKIARELLGKAGIEFFTWID